MIIKQSMVMLPLVLSCITPSYAASSIATPKATATLASACAIKTNDIVFGNIVPGAPSATASATFDVLCSKNLSYNFRILYSSYGSDCSYMLGLTYAQKIYYGIYLNGVTQANTIINYATGTGSIQNYTFDGAVQPGTAAIYTSAHCKSIPSNPGYNPFAIPDNYADTVTFYVAF